MSKMIKIFSLQYGFRHKKYNYLLFNFATSCREVKPTKTAIKKALKKSFFNEFA